MTTNYEEYLKFKKIATIANIIGKSYLDLRNITESDSYSEPDYTISNYKIDNFKHLFEQCIAELNINYADKIYNSHTIIDNVDNIDILINKMTLILDSVKQIIASNIDTINLMTNLINERNNKFIDEIKTIKQTVELINPNQIKNKQQNHKKCELKVLRAIDKFRKEYIPLIEKRSIESEIIKTLAIGVQENFKRLSELPIEFCENINIIAICLAEHKKIFNLHNTRNENAVTVNTLDNDHNLIEQSTPIEIELDSPDTMSPTSDSDGWNIVKNNRQKKKNETVKTIDDFGWTRISGDGKGLYKNLYQFKDGLTLYTYDTANRRRWFRKKLYKIFGDDAMCHILPRKKVKKSKPAIEWLNYMAQKENIVIEHGGNGGERQIKLIDGRTISVDGFHKSKYGDRDIYTVYEFDGDGAHANPNILNTTQEQIWHSCGLKRKDIQQFTKERQAMIVISGFRLITITQNEWNAIKNVL